MITPDTFASATVDDLLRAAARGTVGADRRWFDAIVSHGVDAVSAIQRFGAGDPDADKVDITDAIIAILYTLRSPAGIPWLIEYLRSEPDVPEHFTAALRQVRAEALEPLLALYEELEEEEAGEVAFALATLGVRDERILRILLDRLEYDLSEGAISLGLYGDEAARPALMAALEGEEDQHLRAMLTDAAEQLGREIPDEDFGIDVGELIPDHELPQADLLEDSELLDLLRCADPEYRLAAADACVKSDVTAALLAEVRNRAKSDSSAEVRARCWEALGSEVADNEEIYREVLAKVRDESAPEQERAGALIGLGQLAGEPDVRPWVEKFYQSPSTRAAALAAMWNSLDRSYASYFPQHLDDPDPQIRKHAISGVGYLGITESAEKLRTFFDDDDLRSNALFAYALSARTEVSPGRMRPFLRRIDQLAGGLGEEEEELVKIALDERLLLHGHKPIFRPDDEGGEHQHHVHGDGCAHDHGTPAATAQPVKSAKVGRNDPCPCGSGKKYKKCCGA